MPGSHWWEITITTLQVAVCATVILTPLAIGIGYGLARFDFVGKSVVQTLVLLPMILPPVAVGLALLYLMRGSSLLLTWQAATLAAAVVSFPFYVRQVQLAFSHVAPELEQVAFTLGKSRWQVFWLISLPLAWRGIVYGGVLAFARAMGEFGATALVAGNIPGRTETLALGIYARILNGDDRAAWTLAGVSLAVAFTLVLAAELWVRRRSHGHAPVAL